MQLNDFLQILKNHSLKERPYLLAERAGVHSSTVYNYIKGKRKPQLDEACKILNAIEGYSHGKDTPA